ncbi:hypothetical protein FXO38_15823 [Capsicum annuum]|nr:hypothetical protein FXO37_22338 [Capsicum annuum]KAF3653045.1 hypothetical protein FXO38_15823 [Capsicum annuum]
MDDFEFDEDVPNKIIDQYFDDSRFIQKKELFVVVTDKIWENENDEDAFKFANLYFIHGFLLSSVDIVIIPRLHFDLVDSQIPRLLNWKTNAICPRYESLMESLINDSNDKVVFKNIEPTRKEISTFQISKKGDSSNSPSKKKLKNQSKGVDQHTPKRTPPSRAVKMSSMKTPIFMAIQSKETVPSNRKDIPIQSPDMSFFNREDKDDVLSKKVFEKFRDGVRKEFNDIRNLVTTRCDQIMNSINEMKVKDYEFVKPQTDEADKDTSPHESTPILHHDFDKNLEDTLDKIDTSVHKARGVCDSTNKKIIDESVGEAQFSDSQNTFPDEVLRKVHTHEAVFGVGKFQLDLHDSQVTIPDELLPRLNEYVNLERSIIVHSSANKEQTPVNVSRIKRPSKFKKSPSTTKFGSAEVDHIFIPININSKHHWVLVVLSFNNRFIYVYDSLSSAGHDSAVLPEVEKLAEVIPYCLSAYKFYEKKGIDIDNHPNYKLNDKHDFLIHYRRFASTTM